MYLPWLFHCAPAGVVRVSTAAGQEVATIPLEELSDVRHLKMRLRGLCGLPRFRQRLLWRGCMLEDGTRLDSPLELQLILLRFVSGSHSEVARLTEAAGLGWASTVESLLHRPLDPDSFHCDRSAAAPLCWASAKGHVETVRLLLEAYASVDALRNPDGETPLWIACAHGHVQVAGLLLQAGADKNARNCLNEMPLGVASRLGYVEVVRLLVEAGANKNLPSSYDMTPLCVASLNGRLEVVRWLLAAGADATSRSRYGETPLHAASDFGHEGIVRLLLEAGADKSVLDDFGDRPLCVASRCGHVEALRVLIQSDADQRANDNDMFDALQVACVHDQVDVVKYLLSIGADKKLRCTSRPYTTNHTTVPQERPRNLSCSKLRVLPASLKLIKGMPGTVTTRHHCGSPLGGAVWRLCACS